jgi:hypothetical protein
MPERIPLVEGSGLSFALQPAIEVHDAAGMAVHVRGTVALLNHPGRECAQMGLQRTMSRRDQERRTLIGLFQGDLLAGGIALQEDLPVSEEQVLALA